MKIEKTPTTNWNSSDTLSLFFDKISVIMYGHKIRLIRIARGLNQEDVTKRLGIKENTYSNIETNTQKENEAQLQKIAEVLGVSVEDIKALSRSL